MSLFADRDIEGLTSSDQAMNAILYVLGRIRDEGDVGSHLGRGTQTFAMLTEALASITGKPIAEIREAYCPRHPRS